MARKAIKGLYYITHIDNLSSILKWGILSHELIEQQNIKYRPIYDQNIVSHRQQRQTPDDKSLWYFANLYFQPRNPMLYRVYVGENRRDIAVVEINPKVLNNPGVYITNGNAASNASDIFPAKQGIQEINQLKEILDKEWWNSDDGSKRKIMAECLVPEYVDPSYITAIYVPTHEAVNKLKALLPGNTLDIIPEPYMFFVPLQRTQITPVFNLVEGDMFFSRAQTLTISVNTKGVMGKGLAARAKYQFPDVYVRYQEVCRGRNPQLKLSIPYLYKRETPIDYDLADASNMLPGINNEKWFLLFATKGHWKEQSDLRSIERGLEWISKNYQQEGIKSLALPALGCGLGGLEWSEVGPLMCRYLVNLNISVRIYLPREKEIPPEQLTTDFLLGT
ncbi:MAG: DUF4433 domain-containing protein [Chloroflexaceae bacterium]|nr:DUF4433 domain-containing protein [Chloroflexaceae bacterium]